MDPAGQGALIGLGFLVCFLLSGVCSNKVKELYAKWKRYRQVQLQTPLLPVQQENPLLSISGSKRFQMKELLTSS